MVQHRKPSIFIQFAGQGVKYLDDLRRLFTMQPAIKPFISDCINEIHTQARRYDDTRTNFFHQGLDIETWLTSPDEAPNDGYLLSSPLSHPLIFLTQISNYLSLLSEGVDQSVLLKNTHSVTGFSTGIVSALLVSLNLSLNDLYERAVKTQAMFFWQGIRTQQSMFRKQIYPVISTDHIATPEGSRSCMASINNILRKQLDTLIAEFTGGNIYPAYELFPGRWIVAGSPNDLDRFRQTILSENTRIEWRYIPSTIAAHSPYLSYALETSPDDAAALGLHFNGRELSFSVLSNDNGVDLRQSDTIIHDVMTAYFLKTAEWKKQISPVLTDKEIRYVLDFGPGPGVASLTENFTTRKGIKVIRCTNPIGRQQFLDDIMPELS